MSPWWKRPTEEALEEEERAEEPAAVQEEAPSEQEQKEGREQKQGREQKEASSEADSEEGKARGQAAEAQAEPKTAREEEHKEEKTRSRRRSARRKGSSESRSGAARKDAAEPEEKPDKKTSDKKGAAKEESAKMKESERRQSGSRRNAGGRGRSGSGRKETGDENGSRAMARDVASSIADALREFLASGPEREDDFEDERKIALFCDLENIALGVKESDIKKFDIELVLERLVEKGKIIVKKAYADWQRYSDFKKPLHGAGLELIDIPQKYYSGKNSADIKMVVDAMDLCYSKEHLDTFVLLSGDSDFSPLVSKLKENNKHVIAVGVKSSSSRLLIDNCDEFIYYEDIWRDSLGAPRLKGLDEKTAEVFGLMNDAILALMRENKNVLWGSMVKQTMQRKRPSFNEGYYGYSSFSELLEDAQEKKIIDLKKDSRSGSYIVTGFANRR